MQKNTRTISDITCRHVPCLLLAGCVGKEAACDTCNRLHFVPRHTLLPGFTLSCTRNDLTFPGPCRSIYFGHLGFQGAVTSFVTEVLFKFSNPSWKALENRHLMYIPSPRFLFSTNLASSQFNTVEYWTTRKKISLEFR